MEGFKMINDIRILESIKERLDDSMEKLDIDYTSIFFSITEEHAKKYLKEHNMESDVYAPILDVLENISNQIEDIKEIIEIKIDELYEKEIKNLKNNI